MRQRQLGESLVTAVRQQWGEHVQLPISPRAFATSLGVVCRHTTGVVVDHVEASLSAVYYDDTVTVAELDVALAQRCAERLCQLGDVPASPCTVRYVARAICGVTVPRVKPLAKSAREHWIVAEYRRAVALAANGER